MNAKPFRVADCALAQRMCLKTRAEDEDTGLGTRFEDLLEDLV